MKRIISTAMLVLFLFVLPCGCRKNAEPFPMCSSFSAKAEITGLFNYKAVITESDIVVTNDVFTESVRFSDGTVSYGEQTAQIGYADGLSVFALPEILCAILCESDCPYEAYASGSAVFAHATYNGMDYSITATPDGIPLSMSWNGMTVEFTEFNISD